MSNIISQEYSDLMVKKYNFITNRGLNDLLSVCELIEIDNKILNVLNHDRTETRNGLIQYLEFEESISPEIHDVICRTNKRLALIDEAIENVNIGLQKAHLLKVLMENEES